MDFNSRLKEEIELSNLRYKELAEKSGVPERALYNYVASKNPSMPPADVAVKIANALGVTVEYLVTGKEESDIKKESNITKETITLLKTFLTLSERDRKIMTGFMQVIAEL